MAPCECMPVQSVYFHVNLLHHVVSCVSPNINFNTIWYLYKEPISAKGVKNVWIGYLYKFIDMLYYIIQNINYLLISTA